MKFLKSSEELLVIPLILVREHRVHAGPKDYFVVVVDSRDSLDILDILDSLAFDSHKM
jgi:hypothetical protein